MEGGAFRNYIEEGDDRYLLHRYFTEGRLEVDPYPLILPRLSLGCDPLRKGAGEGGGRRPERSTKSPLIAATLLFSRRASTICTVV